MAGVKISGLPAIPSCALGDLIPDVQPAVGGTTYKATLQQVYDLFNLSSGTVNAGTINQLAWYAANGNAVSGLPTANNGVLVTSAGGVPSIGSTLPTAVQANITQLGAQAAALNMNTHLINNVVDPVSAQDAATKNYVDLVATGLEIQPSVVAATTGALTATYNNVSVPPSGVGATLTNAGAMAAFSIDGVSPTVGQRVLIKNQASALENGIYTVTVVGSGAVNWVLTRATDYDTPAEIQPGDLVVVDQGTVNAHLGFIQTATVTSVGVDAINWSQFGATGTVTSIATSNGVTGGTITTTGTISLASMFNINASAPANSFTMDSSGFITYPVQPAFSAYVTNTSAAVTGDNTDYTITTYTENFDTSSNFNATTGVFTAPKTGRYYLSASILVGSLGAGNTTGTAWIQTSGSGLLYVSIENWAAIRAGTNQAAFCGSAIFQMTAGDTAALHVQEANNGSKNVTVLGTTNSPTTFSGYFMG